MKVVQSLIVFILVATPRASLADDIQDSFLQPLDDDAYAAVLQFFQYDKSELHAEIVDRSETDTYVRQKIVFTSSNGERVPSLLILPKSKQGPFPLVVILPGGDGRKDKIVESTAYHSAYTNDLTAKGYAVFSLDVQFHGERKGNNNYRESLYRNKLINGWRNLVVQTVIDVRRALDYLDTRTEIDVSRVGCIGGSMGGLLTFALTAVEDRISVSVSSVGLPWSQNLWKGFEWDDLPFVQSVIGPQNFAPRINDRPFLMMMATQDRHYSMEDGEELFRLIKSAKKEIIWFESGHSLPRDQQTSSALNWIYEYL